MLAAKAAHSTQSGMVVQPLSESKNTESTSCIVGCLWGSLQACPTKAQQHACGCVSGPDVPPHFFFDLESTFWLSHLPLCFTRLGRPGWSKSTRTCSTCQQQSAAHTSGLHSVGLSCDASDLGERSHHDCVLCQCQSPHASTQSCSQLCTVCRAVVDPQVLR